MFVRVRTHGHTFMHAHSRTHARTSRTSAPLVRAALDGQDGDGALAVLRIDVDMFEGRVWGLWLCAVATALWPCYESTWICLKVETIVVMVCLLSEYFE